MQKQRLKVLCLRLKEVTLLPGKGNLACRR